MVTLRLLNLLTALSLMLCVWTGVLWVRSMLDGNYIDSPTIRHLGGVPAYWVVAVTMWPPMIWMVTLIFWRKEPKGDRLCPRCGYDLRATPERCPECGTPAPTTA